jgi:hypothetical protein
VSYSFIYSIGIVWKETKEGEKAKHISYFPHLAVLANMVIDLSQGEIPSILEIIEISPEWQQHTEPFIDEYNMTMITLISATNVT